MTAQWWGGTTFDQIFFYQWLMKSKNEAKSNDVLKMPKDDWNKMIFINHCTTVNYRYMNPPCNGRYRRAPGSQLMRRPNFVAAIVQIVTYHFPSLVQWSRYSRIKDHDRNQPFFYTYPRDCTNASHFLCGVKHKPTCIPEICVRGCVTSESSPLPPMIEGGGANLPTPGSISIGLREHFHVPTFLLLVQPTYRFRFHWCSIDSTLTYVCGWNRNSHHATLWKTSDVSL